MTQVTRVPSPPSPVDGRWRAAAVVVAAVTVVLLAKPWGPTPDTGSDGTPWRSTDTAATSPTPTSRMWDPASLGEAPPAPAWELWAAGRATRIRFVGPADGFAPRPSVGPGDSAVIGGPVIDLGPADAVTTVAVNRPLDHDIGAIRLWHLPTGAEPERMDLVELPDPWGVDHVRVFGLHVRGLPGDAVAPWRAGLYRLDLLIEPNGRIRTLLINVPTGGDEPPATRTGAQPVLDPRLLRRLPTLAERWAFGQLLAGWSERGSDPMCRVAELWRATDVSAPCHPTPVGRPTALGVNLGPERPVLRLEVHQVDPLPRPVDAAVTLEVDGRPGLAMAQARTGGFADGIYRLEATTPDGIVRWYPEVARDPLE